MSKNNKKMSVPIEFDRFIDNLSIQVSQELGLPKNKTQTMRLIASNFEGKIIFKNKKFDLRLF